MSEEKKKGPKVGESLKTVEGNPTRIGNFDAIVTKGGDLYVDTNGDGTVGQIVSVARGPRKSSGSAQAPKPDVIGSGKVTAEGWESAAETLAAMLAPYRKGIAWNPEKRLIMAEGSPHAIAVAPAEDGSLVGFFVTQRGRPFVVNMDLRPAKIAVRFDRTAEE